MNSERFEKCEDCGGYKLGECEEHSERFCTYCAFDCKSCQQVIEDQSDASDDVFFISKRNRQKPYEW